MSATDGILSKGTTLKYGTTASSYSNSVDNVMAIPKLGGTPNKKDVTTLAHGEYHYIEGLKDYGDLAYKVLFDSDVYDDLYEKSSHGGTAAQKLYFQVELPDSGSGAGAHGSQFTFSGTVAVALDDVAVDAPLTFTLTIITDSEIAFTPAV